MDPVNLVLHVLHIVAGVFWAGGAILIGFFVAPAVSATRPESGRFMQHMTGPGRLPVWMTVAAWVTVLCGIIMFAPSMGIMDATVIRSARGIALSLGALLALAAFLEGNLVNAPTARRIGAIGREIAASGKGPTPEHVQQIEKLQARLGRAATRGAVMLVLTVALMAAARWL